MIDPEKVAEFIATTGLYMVSADGSVDPAEQMILRNALSNYTDQPEKYLYYGNAEVHTKRTDDICAYFAQTDDYTKGILLGTILGLAISDGILHEQERLLYYTVAERLGVTREQAKLLIDIILG